MKTEKDKKTIFSAWYGFYLRKNTCQADRNPRTISSYWTNSMGTRFPSTTM
jgi:hypothetical protein